MESSHPALSDVIDRAEYWARGRAFEDFFEGQRFDHHWSRTITEADGIYFSTQTLHFRPAYFSVVASEAEGYHRLLINPLLVLNIVIGLSVEDLSEAGGPFVGLGAVRFHHGVQAGDTLRASSTTIAVRESKSRPVFGLVTWRTQGFNQNETEVVSFERTNLVLRRDLQHARMRKLLGHERIRHKA